MILLLLLACAPSEPFHGGNNGGGGDNGGDDSADNAPPTAPAVYIEPANPSTVDELRCTITTPSTDPDGDELSYEWDFGGLASDTVDADQTSKGEEWICKARANDGTDVGEWGRKSVQIENSWPQAPLVDVTPHSPGTEDTLRCEIKEESLDVDGDAVTHSLRWERDGVDIALSVSEIPPNETAPGEEWSCYVLPDDGETEGPEGSAAVTIQDSSVCDGAEFSTFDSQEFVFCPNALRWQDARAACQDAGLELAMLKSTDALSWAASQAGGQSAIDASYEMSDRWVGLHNNDGSGWFWVDGTAPDLSLWGEDPPGTTETGVARLELDSEQLYVELNTLYLSYICGPGASEG